MTENREYGLRKERAKYEIMTEGLVEVLRDMHRIGLVDLDQVNDRFRKFIGEISLHRVMMLSRDADLTVEQTAIIMEDFTHPKYNVVP